MSDAMLALLQPLFRRENAWGTWAVLGLAAILAGFLPYSRS